MGAGPVIDQAFTSTRLAGMEEILNRLISRQRLIPLSKDRTIDGAFRYRGLADLGFFTIRFGRDVEIELAPEDHEGRIAFVTTTRGRGQLLLRAEELPITEQSGVIMTSANLKGLKYMPDTENFVFVTEREKISSYCAKLLGRSSVGDVDFDVQSPLDTEAGLSWRRLMDYGSAEYGHPESLVRQFPAARQSLEQMLITGLLLSHRHTYSDLLRNPQSSAAPFYVRRAEEFIEAHCSEPLSLADIAAHAGVSARSLQNGFQSFRHMTPMAFLRSLRLQKVHHALLAADPSVSTVTEIALTFGFTHMGEFGSAYKREFGVMPRQSLLEKNRARA
jgi:AraC-like DNA-binding protein